MTSLPLVVNLVSEHLLLLFSILIFAAVLVTKVGSRYGVPSLLLFLLLGMVAGWGSGSTTSNSRRTSAISR